MKGSTENDSAPYERDLSDEKKEYFKSCPLCNQKWLTRDDFLSDPKIKLLGYQVNFDALTLGIILFNHETCLDTFGVKVEDFSDLKTVPIYQERKTGGDECPGYCLHECELSRCPAKCECAWVRDVIDRLNHWEKTAS